VSHWPSYIVLPYADVSGLSLCAGLLAVPGAGGRSHSVLPPQNAFPVVVRFFRPSTYDDRDLLDARVLLSPRCS